MSVRTTITLARHGRTAWHDPNRYAGSSDIDIDDVGQAQAKTLAAWAVRARPDALYASSLRRTQQTAAPVAAALGLDVRIEGRLRELDFGVAEGRTLAELTASDPASVEAFERDAAQHHLPGGEHPAAAADRATAALADIAAEHAGGHVLIVCHNTLIRIVTCRYLGIDLGLYRTVLRAVEPAATSRFSLTGDGRVTLEYYNRLPEVAYDG